MKNVLYSKVSRDALFLTRLKSLYRRLHGIEIAENYMRQSTACRGGTQICVLMCPIYMFLYMQIGIIHLVEFCIAKSTEIQAVSTYARCGTLHNVI